MKFINVYQVERAYGGPEEGGWWYDDYIPLTSRRANTKRQQKKQRRKLEREYVNPGTAGKILGGNPADLDSFDDFQENDMTGVQVGHDISFQVEGRRAHYKPRPYYC